MTEADLLQRLQRAEDNFTERKQSLPNKQDQRKTLCAFANSLTIGQTAILFIGVHDNGAIVGIADPDSAQKSIREVAENDCYPPITTIVCHALKIEGKEILAVEIGASSNRPHFTGQAYVRRGSESVKASLDMMNELIASRNDKTGRILRMRGEVISLESQGRRIENPFPAPNYRARGECRVTDCDAHTVRFTYLVGGLDVMTLAEPIDAITVSYDTQNRRDMLIIRAIQ